MDKDYGEFVGVDNIHAAIIIEDSADNYLAETPEYFAPVAEITGEPEIESTPTYYDNVPADNYITEGVTTLNIVISGVPAKKAAKYLGKHYDEATGRVLDTGEPNPPDVALSFRYNKGKEDYRYYQYLKGKFSGGSEEAATKTNNIDIKTYSMTFTAVTTTHKWTINGALKQLKRIFADTTETAFDPTGWFNAVQTPDTGIIPGALTLSASDPEDSDIGVTVAIQPELTFSNKLSSYDVRLYKDDFTVVSTTISKDSTGKILTVAPAANLSASSNYILMVVSAIDIYGQQLKDIAIEFATA